MTACDHQAKGWSRNRWLLTGAGLFGVQVLLVLALSERQMPNPPSPPRSSGLTLLDVQADPQGVGRALAQADPLLFALPGVRESGGAARTAVHEPEGLRSLWEAPTLWLPAHSNWFGADAAGRAMSAGMAPRPVAEKPGPQLTQVQPTPVPVPRASRLELGLELARRGLAAPLVLPTQVHSNVLAPSQVQVCVNADGTVFDALVMGSSGFKSADDLALALASSARFQRMPGGGTAAGSPERVWGRMTFHWHVVESVRTNGAVGGAP